MCGKIKNEKLTCTLRVCFQREQSFLGPGVSQLLHNIEEEHSLRAAAQRMHISYTKAWRIVHEAEIGLGFALIESINGGTKGGGSVVTQEGKALLHAYDALVCTVNSVLQQEFETHIQPLIQSLETTLTQ